MVILACADIVYPQNLAIVPLQLPKNLNRLFVNFFIDKSSVFGYDGQGRYGSVRTRLVLSLQNRMAATLGDVIDFYSVRFNGNFTAQEKADLVAFLESL